MGSKDLGEPAFNTLSNRNRLPTQADGVFSSEFVHRCHRESFALTDGSPAELTGTRVGSS
jgi:hypothetical protein